MSERRIGAYVLPGDATWLERTLPRYYPLLDDLVVPVPTDRRGWTGVTIPVDEVLEIVRRVDTRGIARQIEGRWTNVQAPMRADTAQRQAALEALEGKVDWVLQIDNDELLPNTAPLLDALDEADRRGLGGVEWPMRVLFRRTARSMFELVADRGRPRYDYPGTIAIRPSARLVDARRADAAYLRVLVAGDDASLQVVRPAEAGEQRWVLLEHAQAIVHNSWARSPRAVWQKTRSWGHASGLRGVAYFALVWLPAPLTWRLLRDVHPFAHGLWPRVQRRPIEAVER